MSTRALHISSLRDSVEFCTKPGTDVPGYQTTCLRHWKPFRGFIPQPAVTPKRMSNRIRIRRVIAVAFVGVLLIGCSSESKDDSQTSAQSQTDQRSVESTQDANHITAARRMISLGYWDKAAEAAYKALVEEPDNFEAMLLAGEAEAGRGKHDLVIALVSPIDIEWRLGKKAVDLHVRSLYELNRTSESADVLLAAIEKMPFQAEWRHRVWGLLNRVGRREEASRQAESLCRAGQATEMELISLIRRTDAFPLRIKEGADMNLYFEPGLGMARWYFTKTEYREALQELAPQFESGFQTAAASALYGRLLAETQASDQIPVWHAKCDRSTVEELGDYWAALGTYFFDNQQYEASARALMEAVTRNPTDRMSIQRLAKVFDALGDPDQAEQFRQRGIDLAGCESAADSLLSETSRAEIQQLRMQITQQVLELERPFEALAWATLAQPNNANELARKRVELLSDEDALVMSKEASLIGAKLDDYTISAEQEALLGSEAVKPLTPSSREVTPIARPRLVNVASKVGLDFQWYQDREINLASIPIHESIGGGIAVIDYNLDGWPDVYLAQGSGEPPTDQCTRSDVLYRNRNGQFVDVTGPSGTEDFHYGSGLTAGDVNQDGFIDLFLGSLGKNRLLINNGDGTFRDATSQLGNVTDQFSTSLAIADINGDALPDLFEAIYIEMEGAFALPKVGKDGRETQPSPLEHFAESDRWYSSTGDGRFEVHEIPREIAKPGTSLGLVVTNFDNNNGNEVFVGNDVRPNHFLFHAGDNVMVNAADAQGVANGFSGAANGCMGIATADFNRDGTLDLHITNFNQESANLYLQTGGGFTDYAVRYRIDELSLPYVGFGTKAIDFDRDGWSDLAVTNGHIFDMSDYGEGFQMPPQLMMNRGTYFEAVSVDDDSGYWDGTYLGRTMASLDYDRDGASDLLINHLDQPLALLHNQTQTEGIGLQIELVGTQSERDAIGARVRVEYGGGSQSAWVTAGDGYFCSDEPIVEFGLGPDATVTRVEVRWPSGREQTFESPSVPGRYLIVEGDDELFQR